MIPISSAKLNNKLANHNRKRSPFNESCSYKKNYVCLSIGLVLGLCLAGIFFYGSLPNEECRCNSKNVLKIIGLEALHNNSKNNSSSYISLAEKLPEQSTFPSTTVSLDNNKVILEQKDETDEAE